MAETYPPHFALFFTTLFAAQALLFPFLAPESSLLIFVIGG